MFNALVNIGTKVVTKVGFELVKHGPALSIAGGAVGLAVSAYKLGSSKTKLEEILSDKDKQLEKIENTVNDLEFADRYSEEDARNDSKIVYIRTGMRCIALYAPTIILGAASIGFIVAGYMAMARRTAALAAAFAATEESYRKYRANVVEKFGLSTDEELYYGLKATEVTKEIVADNGDKAEVTETVYKVDEGEVLSQYAKFFDQSCSGWSKNADDNLNYLIMMQRTMTDRLRARGYLFLNEVYEALDIPATKAGQVVGWIYDKNNPTGDNFVDFGLYKNRSDLRRFVNGFEPVVLIDPNVDGNIIKYLW